MHELSIASSIIDIVNKQLVQSEVNTAVENVTFVAGKMHAIIPDSLTFHFDVLKRDYELLKDAELIVENLDVIVKCPECGFELKLEEPIFVCQKCASPVEIISGSEMRVDSIEVAEDE